MVLKLHVKEWPQVSDVTGEEGTKRLAHYNQWLRNKKLTSTEPYPGYKEGEVIESSTDQRRPSGVRSDGDKKRRKRKGADPIG